MTELEPSAVAILFLLKVQADHVTKSYQRQILEQMFAYHDADNEFNLLSLM
jgi:hypothetical protein